MAGAFAALIKARKLLLTHFSTRFKGDDSLESMQIMWCIEDMARKEAGKNLQGPNDIIAVWDLLTIHVNAPGSYGYTED